MHKNSIATSGILDGTTIMRFTHATSSWAGTESHIGNLNRILLQRNKMDIIYFYLPDDMNCSRTEVRIGKGKVIKIPLQVNEPVRIKNNESGISSIAARIVNSNRYYLAKETVLPLINSIRPLNCLVKWKNRYLESRVAVDVTSMAEEIFSSYTINLLVNHYAGGCDSREIMILASSRKIPILIMNHFSNKRYYRLAIREQLVYADAVAGLSMVDIPSYMQDRFVNLSNGIDTDFFSPDALSDSIEHPAKPVILLPSRIIRTKGHIELLKTALELKRENIECRLVFAGEIDSVDYKRELDRFITNNKFQDNVIFTGMINRTTLREWYKISKLVVLPTFHQEGIPRVLLEAQAMEVPPITYNRGGVSEAITQNQTGFFFKCGDRASLKKKIAELLIDEQERQRLGKNGRNFILSNFTLPLLAQRHENLYAQLIQNQKTPADQKITT